MGKFLLNGKFLFMGTFLLMAPGPGPRPWGRAAFLPHAAPGPGAGAWSHEQERVH